MKEDIVKTVMANYYYFGGKNQFVDVAVKPVSVKRWSGFRVFRNGTAYEIEMHDRNKFRFWHEIKDMLNRRAHTFSEA